jgi:O-antigen ligase
MDRVHSLPVLVFFSTLVAGYFLGAWFIRSQDDLEWILFAWLVGSIFVCCSGFFQIFGGFESLQNTIHAHPELLQEHPRLLSWAYANRMFATFVSPNALGGYIGAALFVIAAWVLVSRRATKTKSDQSSRTEGLISVGIGGIAMMALMYCFWKCQSKGMYITLLVVVCLYIVLSVRRPAIAGLWFGMILIAGIAGVLLGFGQSKKQQIDLPKLISLANRSLESRVDFWRAAWKIGWKHPILGTGPGTFERVYPSYQTSNEKTRLVHNNYLQMFSDSGLAGAIPFILWLPGSLCLWVCRWWKVPPAERQIQTLLWCECALFAIH